MTGAAAAAESSGAREARRGEPSRASPSQHLPGDTAATGRARSPPLRGSHLPRGPPPATAPGQLRSTHPQPRERAFAGCRPADRSARKMQPPPAPRFRVLPVTRLCLCLLRSGSAGPALRITPRKAHGVPLTGREGRGEAGVGRAGDKRSRLGDPEFSRGFRPRAPALREFQPRRKNVGGREREERE